MYAAVFSRTYAGRSAGEVLSAIRRDGYAGAQMNLSSLGLDSLPERVPDGLAEQARDLARREGLRIAALSGTYNMIHPDPLRRSVLRARFAVVLRAAQALGAPVVSLCSGSRHAFDMWTFHPDNRTEAAWSDFRAELDAVLALIAPTDLVVGIEPEPGNVIADARSARRLLDEVGSPRLRIILDAANLLSPERLADQHRILREAVDLLAGEIVLAHAKDIDGTGTVVPPGSGAVDLRLFVQRLRRANYDGALVGHGYAPGAAAAAAQVLTRLCDEP